MTILSRRRHNDAKNLVLFRHNLGDFKIFVSSQRKKSNTLNLYEMKAK